MSNNVKQQLIQDLQMAGLAPSTQKTYLDIVVRFVRRTRTRPQDASEAQVAEYLRGLIGQGQCQGTIKPARSAGHWRLGRSGLGMLVHRKLLETVPGTLYAPFGAAPVPSPASCW